MSFVREVVSQEDFDKYDLGRYKQRLPMSITANSTYWVIDRERDIYLTSYRSTGNDPEPQDYSRRFFIFYISGDMYEITLNLKIKKLGEGHWSYLWEYQSLAFMPYFSINKEDKHQTIEILSIFKGVVKIYRHAGKNDPEHLDISFNF